MAPASASAPPCETVPLSLLPAPPLVAAASCCACCVPAVVAGTRCSRHSFSTASPLLLAALLMLPLPVPLLVPLLVLALVLAPPLLPLPLLLLLPLWLGIAALRSSYSSPLKICCRTLSCSCGREGGVEAEG